ncbi:translationally controlled tumor protein [Neocallimastix lanati (nom. inval.)]|jgi:hypothetical protein|uniref:Translationally-controlled tumor protein homolog n=1 Tax=Neocallimastix californiae TaxID=1754190 RepID=A0A1Y2FEF6_9FUNG|nr:translationally controlled tumor protein [Neocallimastix sp. JGI-2020a]ORY82303.1 translationally controlled tumor protein [Neocallimastix californiae]|eukprot:ORY82303.1 translationally controlled tumor protein [Neocallimastix californiae]
MILYRDVISGDEIVSDAYKITEIGNGIAIEVDCKMITVSGNDDYDIGANPSAEDEEDGPIPEDAQVVNNVVYSFRLQETQFDKASYKVYMKGYMKSIRKYLQENNPERVPDFEKEAVILFKKILANFKDYEFYVGESMDPDGAVLLLNYREDGVTPYFTIFKDGLKIEKL